MRCKELREKIAKKLSELSPFPMVDMEREKHLLADQILEEMEKRILSEEEIKKVIHDILLLNEDNAYINCWEETHDKLAHALYTAQKEKVK